MRNHLKKLFDKAFSRYVSTGLIFVLDVLLYTVWIWQINRHMKPLPEA